MKIALSKFPGGKSHQLKYLYSIFDWVEADTFIDGCAGMGSVCLNLPKGKYRRVIANDFDKVVNNVWVHFQDPKLFSLLEEKLLETEYNLDNYWKAKHIYAYEGRHPKLDLAWATIVCHRFSRNAMPKNVFQQAGRLRGGQNECINAWQSYQKNLKAIHEAVGGVEVWRQDIVKIMMDKKLMALNNLFYLDPPYPFDTRKVKMYHSEWQDTKHQNFLNAVRDHPSKIVISGRPNQMYEYNLVGWKTDIREITNHMSHKKQKIKNPEVVWTNFQWGYADRIPALNPESEYG